MAIAWQQRRRDPPGYPDMLGQPEVVAPLLIILYPEFAGGQEDCSLHLRRLC